MCSFIHKNIFTKIFMITLLVAHNLKNCIEKYKKKILSNHTHSSAYSRRCNDTWGYIFFWIINMCIFFCPLFVCVYVCFCFFHFNFNTLLTWHAFYAAWVEKNIIIICQSNYNFNSFMEMHNVPLVKYICVYANRLTIVNTPIYIFLFCVNQWYTFTSEICHNGNLFLCV